MTRIARHFVPCVVTVSMIVLSAVHVSAQEAASNELRTRPISAFVDDLPRQSRAKLDSRHIVDWKFMSLGAGLGAAMATDTYSTYRSKAWCPSCVEANPYAAPFINRGPGIAYTAGALFDVGVMSLSAAMRASDNRMVRKVWWAPPVIMIVGHAIAARHNFALQQQCRYDPACGGPVLGR
jgi:hypothetical protein